MKDLSKGQIVASYVFGREAEFNENDYKSIDIVNLCFGQVTEKDGHFGVDISGIAPIGMAPKLRSRGIRVCISLGGWRDDKDDWIPYQNASKTPESRKEVANAILSVLKEYNLDGIDMDWEYPRAVDRNDYVLFMQEIKDTLKAANEEYLITAALPAGTWILDQYDLASLNNVFDYINLMSYDMDDDHKNTSFHSALFESPYAPCDANKSVEFFHENGVDYNKLVLGMAFYGRLFKGIKDNGNGGLGVPFAKKGSINYHKIKSDYLSRLGNGVTEYYNEEWGANYLYDKEKEEFICYDGLKAIEVKCDYAAKKGLGGVMYWAYNDDLSGDLMQVITDKYDVLKPESK